MAKADVYQHTDIVCQKGVPLAQSGYSRAVKFWNQGFEFRCLECGSTPQYIAQSAPLDSGEGRLFEPFFLCEEHFGRVHDSSEYHVRQIVWPVLLHVNGARLPHPIPLESTGTRAPKRRMQSAMVEGRFSCPHCGGEESFAVNPELEPDMLHTLLSTFRRDVATHLVNACGNNRADEPMEHA